MKIAFLSGAYKNAGDYLIEYRSLELLKYMHSNADIVTILRKDIANRVDLINSCDYAVFGGGPLALRNLDGYLPLDICLNAINIPIMLLGIGWYGFNGGSYSTYHYYFTSKTLKFLHKVDNDGLGISCRDINTYNTLKKEGLKNVFMTGCPAWYSLKDIDSLDFKKPLCSRSDIIISDPAKIYSYPNVLVVLKYLKNKYPDARFTYVFHRGVVSEKQKSMAEQISAMNISVVDISNGLDGFHVYDHCDLHVGFRVHAHLYNLSLRNQSILLEEDGRGVGANETLGLPSIKTFNDIIQMDNRVYQKFVRNRAFYANKHLINELDGYLNCLDLCEGQYLLNAYALQKHFFKSMTDFIIRLR